MPNPNMAYEAENYSREGMNRMARLAFEQSPFSMAIFSLKPSDAGRALLWNKALVEQLGYTDEDLKTMTHLSLVHPDQMEAAVQKYSQIIRGELNSLDFITKFQRKDGSSLWVRVFTSVADGVDKKPDFFTTTIWDVTAERTSQMMRKDQFELLNAVMNNSSEAIVVMDSDGKLIYTNPAIFKVFGYTQDELSGQSLSILMDGEHGRKHDEAFQLYKRTGVRSTDWSGIDTVGKRKNGSMVHLRVSFSEFPYGGREVYQGTMVDITKLVELSQRVDAFVEDTLDCFLVTSWDGKIEKMNKAGLEMFGYESMEEIARLNVTTGMLYETDEGNNGEDLRNQFRRIIEERGAVKDFEVRLKKKDGTTFPCKMTATIQREDDGKIIGYAATIRDITTEELAQNLQVEAARRNAEKETEMRIYKQLFHDFGQPITTAIVSLEALKGKLALNIIGQDELEERVARINSELYRIKAFYDYLKVVALERGDIPFRFVDTTPEKLSEIVNDVASRRKEQAEEKGLILKTSYIPNKEVEGVLRADPIHIDDVVVNLLSNAIKYSDKGEISLEVRVENGGVVLLCRDEGIGVGEDDIDHIFNMHHRGSNTEGRFGEGIGLSAVKSIVEKHQGEVTVESAKGKGSTFRVFIPFKSNDFREEGGL